MSRPLLAFVLVFAAGALVAWLWITLESRPGAFERLVSSDGPLTASEPSAELATAAEESGPEGEAVPRPTPVAIPGEILLPIAADAETGVEVRVVLQSSGQPVAGARVRGLGLLERDEEPERQPLVPIGIIDPEADSGDAPVYVTDAKGRTRVPRTTLPADYAASAGELWGRSYFSDSVEPPYVIELAPDAAFRVRVVDSRRSPVAGLPIALGCASSPRDDLWSALTDPLGFVELRHWAAARQRCLDPEEACLRAVLLAHDEDVPRLTYDVAHATKEPLELVLPPLGRVAVRVRTVDGIALHAPDLVLSRAGDGGRDGQPKRDAEVFEPERWDESGALFEHVGLHLELRASSIAVGFGGAHVVGAGPRSADETAVLELVVGEPVPVLTGRLLGPDGQPLRHCAAQMFVHQGGFVTDAEGRFRVLCRKRPGAVSSRDANSRITYVDERSISHQVDFRLPDVLQLPENDLGDLRFSPMVLVASGRIYDAEGRIRTKAEARLKALSSTGDDVSSAAHIHSTRLSDGAFEFWGEVSGQRWLLTADEWGCEDSKPVEVSPGSRGVRIVLGEGGTARGRIVLGGRSAKELQVTVQTVRGGSILGWTFPLEPDGSFRFASTHGGRHELRVQELPSGTVLARIEGLELEPGVECADPRLEAIVLELTPPK